MLPDRQHANGVPWLVWVGRTAWTCEACGKSGGLPPMLEVAGFARCLGDLKRAHAACGSSDPDALVEDAVGHPLNPDRVER